MSDPIINMGLAANIYVKQLHFLNAGDSDTPVSFVYDHLALLAKGKIIVNVNGQETEFTAPKIVFIKSNITHQFKASTDNSVVYLVQVIRDSNAMILDPSMVPKANELYQYMQNTINTYVTTES
jgi:aspartyl/asparaginyl beta-hydroxylase (cupin superfamily)